MIKETTYYDIICDRCGKSLIKESNTCYPDTEIAEFIAFNCGWMNISGKNYCPDCYEWDEVTDEHIPKKGGKQSRTILCGECEKFLYEDIEGYGFCGKKDNEECYCGDRCHLINGKP